MENIGPAVLQNLQPEYLLTLALGTIAGTIIGALPGLSAVSGVALLLPFTFGMPPAQGLIMLAAVYASAEMGGAIPAILMRTPGTSGAAVTALDGYPLTLKGQAQEALYLQLLSGVVGGIVGGLVLLFLTPLLARWSLLLGPAEYFWLTVAGLALVATLSASNIIKGLIGASLGVILTLPGQDGITGEMRFTFDAYQMVGGIPLVPALLGLFAVASIFDLLDQQRGSIAPLIIRSGVLRYVLGRMRKMKRVLAWSSVLGTITGVIPGAGASLSAFVAYGEAKRISHHPEEFGKGSWEGIAAPECANNAVVPGAMIPLLGLGIPGSGSAAIMYGALTVHGIIAGPRLFTERADIAYTFIVGLMFTVVAMLIFGLLTVRYSSLIVKVPLRFLVPSVLALAMIGTYGLHNSLFDVGVLLVIGVLGYLLAKVGIPAVTIALGLVLGKLIEQNYQRSVLVGTVDSGSVLGYFASRPIAIVLALVAIVVLVSGVLQVLRTRETTPTMSADA